MLNESLLLNNYGIINYFSFFRAGVVAEELVWSYAAGDYALGETASLAIETEISVTEDSRDVDGLRLWNLALFASTADDGTGRRVAVQSQILDAYNQAQALTPPAPLQFNLASVRYDMNPLGCTAYGYLCLEYSKQSGSDPDFKFETTTGGDSLISCKEVQCRGEIFVKFFSSV